MKKRLVALALALVAVANLSVPAAARTMPFFDGLAEEYYEALDIQEQASQSDDLLLGSLSAKYESNGDPSTISGGGDSGGVSYGAYQFSSRYGIPLDFAKWCISSGKSKDVGQRLVNAYAADGETYGSNFNSTWRAIASEDASGFLLLQHGYTKAKYYDVMVAKLEAKYPGFVVNNYTLALKNVIWSRTVQHGANTDCITKAFEAMGGFKGQTEDAIIRAIYDRSSLLVSTPPVSGANAIKQSSAVKYGLNPSEVAGKYMYYFSTNSSDVQASVYRRLTVTEPNDALEMYREYSGSSSVGDYEAPADGDTTTSLLNLLLEVVSLMVDMFLSFIQIFLS